MTMGDWPGAGLVEAGEGTGRQTTRRRGTSPTPACGLSISSVSVCAIDLPRYISPPRPATNCRRRPTMSLCRTPEGRGGIMFHAVNVPRGEDGRQNGSAGHHHPSIPFPVIAHCPLSARLRLPRSSTRSMTRDGTHIDTPTTHTPPSRRPKQHSDRRFMLGNVDTAERPWAPTAPLVCRSAWWREGRRSWRC